ncbi:hypothetical protein SDC9_199911 [bioreactor metagenome]|uniref:Uncharacterized protein n=1 Tax=bioreactor metagenome TaxID=1076179 RepID=A0A645ILR2_9ZZZZ
MGLECEVQGAFGKQQGIALMGRAAGHAKQPGAQQVGTEGFQPVPQHAVEAVIELTRAQGRGAEQQHAQRRVTRSDEGDLRPVG